MRLPLLLAFRFLKSSAKERTLSTMLRICFISIVLGTGSLTLIASIMNGFEAATHKKLQGVHADLTIYASGNAINYPKLSKFLQSTYHDKVTASSPTSIHHVMVQAKTQSLEDPYGTQETSICMLKAVDPTTEPQVSALGSMITKGSDTPWKDLTSDSIFMGQALAKRLCVSAGSTVTLLYQPDETTQEQKVRLEKRQVTIAALFKTGIHDFDEQILVAPYSLVNQLYPSRVTHVSLSLKDPSQTAAIRSSLSKRLSLEVYSWQDLYPPLVSALTLEKYAMWIILLLVTLVASLTIIALLYMYTIHKRVDIALLKAMGMQDRDLKKIFLSLATLITFSATFCGIGLAALGTWFLNTYPFIKLPDVYYVSHLPASLTSSIIFSVLLFAFVVSLCAGLFPNSRLASMRITRVLKGLEL